MKQRQWWHLGRYRTWGSRGRRALDRRAAIYQHVYNGERRENTHNLSQRYLICIWVHSQPLCRRWLMLSIFWSWTWWKRDTVSIVRLLGRGRRLDISIFHVNSSVIGRRRLGCFTLSRSPEMPVGDRNRVYIDMRISDYRRHECGRKTWVTRCN